jgi:hypothetical protein
MLADTTKAQAFITKPSAYSQFSIIDTIKMETTALYFKDKIDSVIFYANNKKVGKSVLLPYQSSFTNLNEGNYSIFSKVYTSAGNVVPTDTISVTVLGATVPVTPLNNLVGLNYMYYQGTWDMMPDFNQITPLDSGIVTNVSTTRRKQDQYFAFQYDGYIRITKQGQYTFYLNSDDGSNLSINNVQLINNDGLHASQEVSGNILLREGYYKIGVNFFQKEGDQVCELRYDGPGITKMLVPNNVLTHDDRFTPMRAAMITPVNNSTYYQGDTIHFETSVNGSPAKISSLDYVISDVSAGSVSTLPYTFDWIANTTTGMKQVYSKVVLGNKQSFNSPGINITILPKITGIASIGNSGLFKLFPNPASDELNIQYLSNYTFKGRLSISDLYGREILHKNIDLQSGVNNLYLDVSPLPAGVYIGSIFSESNKKLAINKFIKQ